MGCCVLASCFCLQLDVVLKYISVNNNVTAAEPNHSAWQPVWKFVPSVQQGIWSIYIKTAEVICSRVPMRQHEGHKMVFRYRKHSSPWFCSRTHWKGGKAFSCHQLSSALQKCNWWSPSISSWASIQKLPPVTSTTRLHDRSPGIPDGGRLPGHQRVWCASPHLLGECPSPLCFTSQSQEAALCLG